MSLSVNADVIREKLLSYPPHSLVQLFVSNLDRPALVLLILEETNEDGDNDTKDNDVACSSISILLVEIKCLVKWKPTDDELDHAARQLNDTLEEVGHQIQGSSEEGDDEGDAILGDIEGGMEEGPDDLDDRLDEIGE